MVHTLSQSSLAVVAFAPAALTNATVSGASVDTQNADSGPYRRVTFFVEMNPGAATTANFQVQESADNSTWVNVSGGTLGTAVSASTYSLQAVEVDMAKRKRYLRVQVIGTGTAGAAAAICLLSEGETLAPNYAASPILL